LLFQSHLYLISSLFLQQAFDAINATLDTEAAAIKSDISSVESSILKLENDWKEYKLAIDRAEMLLEKASDELMGISTIGGQPRMTLKETLSHQIREQEKLLLLLQEVKCKEILVQLLYYRIYF
jgi:septal ring factor EnvC (AmiA/AmiB activator)